MSGLDPLGSTRNIDWSAELVKRYGVAKSESCLNPGAGREREELKELLWSGIRRQCRYGEYSAIQGAIDSPKWLTLEIMEAVGQELAIRYMLKNRTVADKRLMSYKLSIYDNR